MSRRFLAGAAVLACALLGLGVVTGPAADEKGAPGKDVFGMTKLWAFHLEIPAKEYEAMQPPAGGFGVPGAPPAPPAPGDKRDSERNLFGTEFRWAQGDFSAGDKTYKKVGVRYSGEITYFASSQGLKRPLKIDFGKFGDQKFVLVRRSTLHLSDVTSADRTKDRQTAQT